MRKVSQKTKQEAIIKSKYFSAVVLLRRHDQPRKVFEATVIRAFSILREAAAGQLALREMIREAIATDSLLGTTAVGAGAMRKIRFLFTVHISSSTLIKTG
jgi:hypothetical protein